MTGSPSPRATIIYDGQCGFCSHWIRVVLDRDRQNIFAAAARQSPGAEDLLRPFGLKSEATRTVVLLAQGRVFLRSAAVLEIARRMGLPWSLAASLARLIPAWLRDMAYDFVARNRHRFSRGAQICRLPSAHNGANGRNYFRPE